MTTTTETIRAEEAADRRADEAADRLNREEIHTENNRPAQPYTLLAALRLAIGLLEIEARGHEESDDKKRRENIAPILRAAIKRMTGAIQQAAGRATAEDQNP